GQGLGMLAAVTRALPDSSVLTSLAWSADGSGVVVGAARRATDVVARLDRVGTLAGVRLGGPVVRGPIGGRGWEGFTILVGRDVGRRARRPGRRAWPGGARARAARPTGRGGGGARGGEERRAVGPGRAAGQAKADRRLADSGGPRRQVVRSRGLRLRRARSD